MLDFSGNDGKARELAVHYAERLKSDAVLQLIRQDHDVQGQDEARQLAIFFWQMLDLSALDTEQGKQVCGELNNQYWMERLLNIIGGYLQKRGYGDLWQAVCDEM